MRAALPDAALVANALPAAVFTAEADDDVDAFLDRWAALQATPETPFQTAAWLRSWYDSLGQAPGRRPVCVTVRQAGRPVMLLPLVASRERGSSVLRFADEGVTDYNAPLLVAHIAPADAPALWRAIRSALAGHDLLRVDKLLASLANRPNPLATAWAGQPCEMFGNHLWVDADYDAWRFSLDKTVRKEFERTWRVFSREPEARFERIVDAEGARNLFAELEAQQRQRMAHAGDRYRLDRPEYSALYRDRLLRGLSAGSVVLTALRARGELVAALYGICDGRRYVALRISHAGEGWRHCAPGKLLLERTIHHLHEQGLRHIDFAIGDYFHKRVFKVAQTPLLDACVALSWRGLPAVAAWRVRRALKRQRWVVDAVRKLKARA